jgi:phosphocarrier protein HPr
VASREVDIVNRQGLHARPATQFVEAANRFASRVTVVKDDKRVNGKSVMEMMLLDAEQGTTLRIEAEGDDADECLAALAEVIRHFDENAATKR